MMLSTLGIAALAVMPISNGISLEQLRVYQAPEARQGVATDRDHFYAITNRMIGKYRKSDGKRVDQWQDPEGGPFIHLNGGIVMDGMLYGFHSNFPQLPMTSSIEVFDLQPLRHRASIPLGVGHGSLVWAIPHPRTKEMWVGFGHYNGRGGTPGVTNDQSRILVYRRERRGGREIWSATGEGYGFAKSIVDRWDGMTASGAIFLPDGRLLLTGHHAPEVHVASVPSAAAAIQLQAVIPSPCEGQGIALDADGTFWQIQRKDGTVRQYRISWR